MGFGKYFLIAISVSLISLTIPSAFAVSVSAPEGTSVPGCEETNECFIPAHVTINVGDTVTWYNDDTAAHTVTSGTASDGPDGYFDSSLFMAGTTFEVTFDEAGDYPYHCMVHPWMVGTVTVVGSSTPPSSPTVVAFDSSSYNIGDTVFVIVDSAIDNALSSTIEIFLIQVSSDSDPSGMEIYVIETGSNTGIFDGSFILGTSTSGDTFGVSPGDVIFAEYRSVGDSAGVKGTASCDPSYPDVCIPPYPPDLDCGEISYTNFKVLQPDPHGFDGDNDGIGCEDKTQEPEPESEIPSWVRNNAGWWADGLISFDDFVSGIQFLMAEGILNTNPIPDEFPLQLIDDAGSWADGLISDDEFISILENWIENPPTEPTPIPSGPPITVRTDRSSYDGGDRITISGEVSELLSGFPVTLQVIAANGNIVAIHQVEVDSSKKFSIVLTDTNDPVWKSTGTYLVKVLYGTESRTAETTFEFTATPTSIPKPPQIIPFSVFTDKASYDDGEMMTISGIGANESTEIDIEINSPTGREIIELSLRSTNDGEFSTIWRIDVSDTGTYTIEADDGTQITTTSFFVDAGRPSSPPPSTSSEVHVSLPAGSSVPGCEETNECFIPADVTINVGDTVTWSNDDTAAHTVTSGSAADGPDGHFDSSLFMAGTTFSVVFDDDATFPYFCMVHPWMVGTVTVGIGGPVTSPPTPVPSPTPTPTPEPEPTPGTDIVLPAGSSVPGCEETNECYIPFRFSARTGQTVTWFNADTAAHTVTSGSAADGPDGNFDSSLFMAGTTFSHTFRESGTFDYFCMVHPWMTGIVSVSGDGTPPPSPDLSLTVTTDDILYDLGEIVEVRVQVSGKAGPHNVAITVSDPTGVEVVSRSVTTSVSGHGNLEFRLPEDFKAGTYRVVATSSVSGQTLQDTTRFKIESQFEQIQIISVAGTDQQGNPKSFTAGEMGFVKVVLQANKNIATLVTVNLFDSELTSIGIASFKTTLSKGESEIILSFMIPSEAATGPADIYANAFSDWPSNGGVPQTGESSAQVTIR